MKALQPGACIGIVGGGQLGRMLAIDARRMGYRTVVLDPSEGCPTGQVADRQIVAPYDDPDAVAQLARSADVLTYEFENADAALLGSVRQAPVLPDPSVLRVAQHRLREKSTLQRLGFPVPAFAELNSEEDVRRAHDVFGPRLVLKTTTLGYDGKGQARAHDLASALSAFAALHTGAQSLIAEQHVDFVKELSVVCARDASGGVVAFPVAENIHEQGILDVSIAPARVDPGVRARAEELVRTVTDALGVVGLLAVELFLLEDGGLLINEMAPRPHNSGHYTLDACLVSQFEQLLRAVCRLPLGAADLLAPAAMANLLGDVWLQAGGAPNFAAALAQPATKLHLYGKAEARPGRKMGHLCTVAHPDELALDRVLQARRLAARSTPGSDRR